MQAQTTKIRRRTTRRLHTGSGHRLVNHFYDFSSISILAIITAYNNIVVNEVVALLLICLSFPLPFHARIAAIHHDLQGWFGSFIDHILQLHFWCVLLSLIYQIFRMDRTIRMLLQIRVQGSGLLHQWRGIFFSSLVEAVVVFCDDYLLELLIKLLQDRRRINNLQNARIV